MSSNLKMMSLDEIKKHNIEAVTAESNYDSAYKTYVQVSYDDIKVATDFVLDFKEVNTEAFSEYMIMKVLADPSRGYSVDGIREILNLMSGGRALPKDFLDLISHTPMNLVDLVNPMISKKSIEALVSYVPQIGGTSIGRGELAIAVLAPDAKKLKGGGDITIGGVKVEVKGNSSQMKSQNSLIEANSIRPKLSHWLSKYHNIHDVKFQAICKNSIEEYYRPLLGDTVLADFMHMVVTMMMHEWKDTGRMEWIRKSCWDADGKWSWEEFSRRIPIFEFDYYKHCEKFDRVIFINTDNLNVVSVDEMTIDMLENFVITAPRYRFDRVSSAVYWTLK